MNKLSLLTTTLLLIIISFLGVNIFQSNSNDAPTAGTSDKFFGGSVYTLAGSGVTSSGTSVTLTKLTLPQNDYPIQDSDLADTFYITLEPGNTSRQEFASCTTVGANTGGNVTLSGCTRGLAPISPYTASTTLQFSHSGGSSLIFSNSPNLYDQAAFKDNDETITGLYTFNTVLPTSSLTATTSEQLTNKTYVDNVTNAGAATSTTSNGGIVELGTRTEAASTTALTAEKPLVLTTDMATSTPGSDISAAGGTGETYIAMTEDDGFFSQLFTDLTEAYTWTGAHIFNTATSTFNSGVDIDADADSPLVLNTVELNFPSSLPTATSTTLAIDTLGNITYRSPFSRIVHSTTTDRVISNSTVESPLFASTTIPANTLGVRDVLRFKLYADDFDQGGGGTDALTIRVKYGDSVVCSIVYDSANTDLNGFISGEIIVSTSSVQEGLIGVHLSTATGGAPNAGFEGACSGTTDITVANEFAITGQFGAADASNNLTILWSYLEVLRNY